MLPALAKAGLSCRW